MTNFARNLTKNGVTIALGVAPYYFFDEQDDGTIPRELQLSYGEDLPQPGRTLTNRERRIPYQVEVRAAAGDDGQDLEDKVNALFAVLPADGETATLTISRADGAGSVTATIIGAENVQAPYGLSRDVGAFAIVSFDLIAEPFTYGTQQTITDTAQLVLPASPSGSTYPVTWSKLEAAGGVVDADSSKYRLTANNCATVIRAYSPVVTGLTEGETLRLTAITEITSFAAGAMLIQLVWRNSGHATVRTDVLVSRNSVGPALQSSGTYTCPATAVEALVYFAANQNSTLTATMWDIDLGREPRALPGIANLASQAGIAAAPYDFGFDALTHQLDCFWAGRFPDPSAAIGDFVTHMGAASWHDVSGVGAATSNLAQWPDGLGTKMWRTSGECYTDIDVSDYPDGEYLVLVRIMASTGADEYVKHAYCGWTLIPSLVLQWLSLGTVTLPTARVRGSATASLRVSIKGAAGPHYAAINCVAFLPVSFGGVIGWRRTGGLSALTLTLEDGILYADDVAALAEMMGGKIVGKGGCLVMIGDTLDPLPLTVGDVTVKVTPRWEQLPSS